MSETSPPRKLLAGVRVLDFTQYLAGPAATRLLSEFGADVVKIERTPDGDLGRKIHFVAPGVSAFFLAASAGKKSVAVEFRDPAGRELVERLVRDSDVVIENFSPGVMAKYGFDYASLKAINPRIVMCSISGFGQQGPYANFTSFDIIAQAQSGVMAMTGEPDGPPQYVGNYFGDPNAGVHAAFAVAAALYHRALHGEGQYIDLSQLEALVYLDYINLPLNMMSEGRIKPTRFGGDFFNICPYGTYRARDGYLVLAVMEHQWAPLVRAMGRPDLETDERYATQAARCARRPEVRALVEAWLQSLDSDEAALAVLGEARVPAAPILEIEQVHAHPQHAARQVFQHLPHPELGATPLARAPFRLSSAQSSIPFRAPYLGEHNEDILRTRLGYSAAEVAELYARGAIVQDPKLPALRAAGKVADV